MFATTAYSAGSMQSADIECVHYVALGSHVYVAVSSFQNVHGDVHWVKLKGMHL